MSLVLPGLRLTEVPIAGREEVRGAAQLTALRRALLPALLTAHASGRPFSCCWSRTTPGGPIQVLVNLEPDDRGGISYPPGARAAAVDPEALRSLPAWIGCTGSHDVLTALPDLDPEPLGLLEDLLQPLSEAPFAWLVLAEPVRREQAAELLEDLHFRITIGLDREKVSGREALELERNQARFRDISTAIGGLWSVRTLAGGLDAKTAITAAALLCGTADLHTTPYTLEAGTAVGPLTETYNATPALTATGELLTSVARPPFRELPGIRGVEQVRFDLTPEIKPGGVPLGVVIDRSGREVTPLDVSRATLNRHALVAGATGSGKSQTVRHLLEGLHAAGVPWLVVEPAKAEYAAMAGRLATGRGVAVIRLGDPAAIPLGLNPLEPEAGFPLQTHLDLVKALFLAAFEAAEPFPQVLSQALTRAYTGLGWDLALSEAVSGEARPRFPTLNDLQTSAREVVDQIGYGAELAADVRGFVDVRLTSLQLGTTGRFLGSGHQLDIADLLRRNVVLELEDVGDDQDKAFCMGVVLIRLVEHLRVRHAAAGTSRGELRHVTVIEEAHRLLKATTGQTPAAQAVEMFASLLAEIRAYGEGIVVAEQIPGKLVPDVVKNSALKVLHRLPAADDRETVGATMNLDEAQSRAVVSLPPGRAAVFTDGMDRPVLVNIPYGEHREKRELSPPTVAVAARRSAACGSSCASRPCTLREISDAGRAVEPRLTLWIELLTVAHVAGLPRPVPEPQAFAELAALATRTLECAIGAAVERAIESRYRLMQSHFPPEQLASHLAAQATAVIADGSPCCSVETEYNWQAGLYRYIDAARALASWHGTPDRPHPLTAAWAERGLRLTGTTISHQLSELRRHPLGQLPATPLLLGQLDPAAIPTTVRRLAPFTDAVSGMAQAATFLTVPLNWHLHLFADASRSEVERASRTTKDGDGR